MPILCRGNKRAAPPQKAKRFEFSFNCRYYCDEETTSYNNMIQNKTCTAGQYCKEGLDSLSDSVPCHAGYYCPEATPVELECPTGTRNPATGRPSISDCLPCIAG